MDDDRLQELFRVSIDKIVSRVMMTQLQVLHDKLDVLMEDHLKLKKQFMFATATGLHSDRP